MKAGEKGSFVLTYEASKFARDVGFDVSGSFRFERPKGHTCRLSCESCIAAFEEFSGLGLRLETLQATGVLLRQEARESAADVTQKWVEDGSFLIPPGFGSLTKLQVGNIAILTDIWDSAPAYDLATLAEPEPIPQRAVCFGGSCATPVLTGLGRLLVGGVYTAAISLPGFLDTISDRFGIRFTVRGTVVDTRKSVAEVYRGRGHTSYV
jgi:hypothetical protein